LGTRSLSRRSPIICSQRRRQRLEEEAEYRVLVEEEVAVKEEVAREQTVNNSQWSWRLRLPLRGRRDLTPGAGTVPGEDRDDRMRQAAQQDRGRPGRHPRHWRRMHELLVEEASPYVASHGSALASASSVPHAWANSGRPRRGWGWGRCCDPQPMPSPGPRLPRPTTDCCVAVGDDFEFAGDVPRAASRGRPHRGGIRSHDAGAQGCKHTDSSRRRWSSCAAGMTAGTDPRRVAGGGGWLAGLVRLDPASVAGKRVARRAMAAW
jgi:hypothetical protein